MALAPVRAIWVGKRQAAPEANRGGHFGEQQSTGVYRTMIRQKQRPTTNNSGVTQKSVTRAQRAGETDICLAKQCNGAVTQKNVTGGTR